jgi:KaiC/GvpD/RAD55 family RecA-like ATPase/CheY-like chemotaxis protein
MARILVVDDEPDERFLLRRMLEREGYEVLDASDGAAALAIVRESRPDLILTDMMMPVMDGAELIGRLRSDPATAGIPILASTGDPGLAGFADVVMSKSVPLEDLSAAVSACLKEGAAVSPGPEERATVSPGAKEGRDPLTLMPTGITGLDLVLNGGLERGSVVVLAGAPGTGKTILAQQICFAKATAAHKAVYYTTVSEPHTKLVRHLESFGFFDREALGSTVEYIHLGSFLVPRSEDGLEPLVSEIVRKTLEDEPAIVVLDSSKMLRDFADEQQLRSALYSLTSRVAHTDTVLLLVGEYTPQELAGGIEFSLADGIIYLEYQPREPVDRRSLRVMKVRGSGQRPGRHTFQITSAGIGVFPRIETLIPEATEPAPGRITTGIPGLDQLMDGGPQATDATLVAGPSGVGKTIFGLRWTAHALEQGQRCLYVTFQDTP